MTHTGLIDRYIRQTKLNCEERVAEPFYAALKGTVFDMFVSHFHLKAGFRVVYSPSRRAERIIVGDETWLVYDQYLGQTFSTLNRILFETEGEKPAIVYFHKYIAERTLEYGCPKLGVHFANFFHYERQATRGSGEPNPSRGAYTITQERFAIFHELGHELQNSSNDLVGVFTSLVSDTIENRRDRFTSTTLETMTEDFRKGSPAAYHDKDLETFLAELAEFHSSQHGQMERRSYLRALDNSETASELFCDFLAAEFALLSLDGSAEEIVSAIRALYIGSYHLKMLTYVDWHLEHILLRETPATIKLAQDFDRIQAIQVRNHCFKSHLLFIYGARLRSAGAADVDGLISTLNERLMLDQKHYYERIFDPVGKLISFVSEVDRLNELAAEALAPLATVHSPDELDLIVNLAILKNTGWPLSFAEHWFPGQS
ncbi:hypothetical protein M2360_005114 [Rhizobium sp. SG_E_25_P2]|uniref:hypothetical protein n=1 Tax=Rhizobium sp. SG_E_25_P2 TaxID=2879942 RepID=UPI002475CA58|nr:hypothetical protein [Rhizobium sp. SG_E_25_P2]MDH6269686.1 hypothetical protein [Rhizobium sp. SG_E_25_P2]